MRLLDLTLATPAENLALDESLLIAAEEEGPNFEALRLWESPQPAVVLGRSSRAEVEAKIAHCRAQGVPILRRPSGGAAVMIGPGCLMFALVLSYERRPELQTLAAAHALVLGRLVDALRPHLPSIALEGTSDLVFQPSGGARRKFSGNSLRCRRTHLLYHGTLLYGFPLELLGACLGEPARQPAYRAGRAHDAFVANVPLSVGTLRQMLTHAWQPTAALENWLAARVAELVSQRYSRDEWNFER